MSPATGGAQAATTLRPRCARTAGIAGVLWVLASATLATTPLEQWLRVTPTAPWVVPAIISASLAAAGFAGAGRGLWLRALATLSLGVHLGFTLADRVDDPARGLLVLSVSVGLVAYLWPNERLRRIDALQVRGAHPVAPALVALFAGLEAWMRDDPVSLVGAVALGTAFCLPPVLALGLQPDTAPRLRRGALVAAVAVAWAPLVGAALPGSAFDSVAALGALAPVVALLAAPEDASRRARLRSLGGRAERTLVTAVLENPARVLVVSFAALCVVGTLLLRLPFAVAPGQTPLSWVDAAFMAVSATCVTGLATVDVPVVFGHFGEFVLLVLIQVGGLGVMVFSAAGVVLLGRRLSLRHERAAAESVGVDSLADVVRAMRVIFVVTGVTETAAALVLTSLFVAGGEPFWSAAWRGVFTAVSAFCNAGFALQSDSVVGWAGSPLRLGVVALAITVGGLGPGVVADVMRRDRRRRMLLTTRLVLGVSALLVVIPAVLIGAFEWSTTLGDLSVVDRVANALFQSVTLRTAGFNSIDMAALHPATVTLMIVVMFIGGSPGSTAGGVRTTTLAVLGLAVLAVLRGRREVQVAGRTVPADAVLRATAMVAVGATGIVVATLLLQLTQNLDPHAAVFEVVSALATVGLTVGATGALDEVGKAIIIACMFTGRVGFLTLVTFLAAEVPSRQRIRFPEESVPVT